MITTKRTQTKDGYRYIISSRRKTSTTESSVEWSVVAQKRCYTDSGAAFFRFGNRYFFTSEDEAQRFVTTTPAIAAF